MKPNRNRGKNKCVEHRKVVAGGICDSGGDDGGSGSESRGKD